MVTTEERKSDITPSPKKERIETEDNDTAICVFL
jgi:hypothetical protein